MDTKKLLAIAGSVFISVVAPLHLYAEYTTGEKVDEAAQDTGKNMKKAGRSMKDAVCMKGDAACAAQKAKHKMQNGGDEVSDKVDDVKKHVN
jgi:hypothetical protein